MKEGTKFIFKANGPTIDTKDQKEEKGLDAVMVTAFN